MQSGEMKRMRDAIERAKNQVENCFPIMDPEEAVDIDEWMETVTIRVRSILANLDEALAALADDARKSEELRALINDIHHASESPYIVRELAARARYVVSASSTCSRCRLCLLAHSNEGNVDIAKSFGACVDGPKGVKSEN